MATRSFWDDPENIANGIAARADQIDHELLRVDGILKRETVIRPDSLADLRMQRAALTLHRVAEAIERFRNGARAKHNEAA